MYDTILVKLDGAPTDRPVIEVQASDWSSGSHYFLFADKPPSDELITSQNGSLQTASEEGSRITSVLRVPATALG